VALAAAQPGDGDMTAFLDFDTLKVGDCRQLTKIITDNDIRKFVELTGDDNPLHVDPKFAHETAFKDIVVHGMLGASFISTVIGTKLPGPGAIYLAQTLKFKAPVKIGDTVVARCTIKELTPEKRKAKFDTVCTVRGKVVLEGEADIMVPAR